MAYGELSNKLTSKLFWQLGCGENDRVVDIGSGVGNLCFQSAAQYGCSTTGVEIREDLHEVARDLGQLLNQELRQRDMSCGEIELLLGDVRHPSQALMNALQNATIIILNNVVFPPSLDIAIFKLLKKVVKLGTKVISFKDCFPRLRKSEQHLVSPDHPLSIYHLPPHQFLSEPNCVSWTASPVQYQVYVVCPRQPIVDASDRDWKTVISEWREECEDCARDAINPEAFLEEERRKNEIERLKKDAADQELLKQQQKKRKSKNKRKEREKILSVKKKSGPHWDVVEEVPFFLPPSPEKSRRKAPERRDQRNKKSKWEYVEEIPFILPPSPPKVRTSKKNAYQDSIQTKNISSKRQKAVIRQRPKSPSPLRTRAQRRKLGKEVPELKKLVIWEQKEDQKHDDFCALCIEPTNLIECNGMCWRSFHRKCVGLKKDDDVSEWVCTLCQPKEGDDVECSFCGISGFGVITCAGYCEKVFHPECVGFIGAEENWQCEKCIAGIIEPKDEEEQELVQDVVVGEESEGAVKVFVPSEEVAKDKEEDEGEEEEEESKKENEKDQDLNIKKKDEEEAEVEFSEEIKEILTEVKVGAEKIWNDDIETSSIIPNMKLGVEIKQYDIPPVIDNLSDLQKNSE